MLVHRWQAPMIPTIEQIKTMFFAEGLQPQEEIYESSMEVKNHKHAFDEIRMLVRGELLINVSGNKLILRAGDRIEIPSNTRHSTKAEGTEECVSVWAKRPFRI